MTRHPGGVAAHIISRFRNPTRRASEPRVAYVPPHPVPIEPHVPSPSHELDSSSPHAVPLIDPVARRTPELIPYRHVASPFDQVLSLARASFLTVLLNALLDSAFRVQLRVIMSLIDGLGIPDPPTLRRHLHPVFESISLPLH